MKLAAACKKLDFDNLKNLRLKISHAAMFAVKM
jgi:hypothetical protein